MVDAMKASKRSASEYKTKEKTLEWMPVLEEFSNGTPSQSRVIFKTTDGMEQTNRKSVSKNRKKFIIFALSERKILKF